MQPRLGLALLALSLTACDDTTTATGSGAGTAGSSGASTSGGTDDPTNITVSASESDSQSASASDSATTEPSTGADTDDTTTGDTDDTTTGDTDEPTTGDESSSSGDACADAVPPQLLSMTRVAFPRSPDSIEYDLTFDQEVTIAMGGLSVDGGASIAGPMLPATGETITVTIEDAVGPGPFTLTVDAASVEDTACGLAPDADAQIQLSADCADNTAPSSTSATFHQLASGTMADTYEVTFDEPVTLQAGAITVAAGSATIDSVSPALPATSDSFTVEVSNLGAIEQLAVTGALASDGCGANLEEDVDLWICTESSFSFDYTGAAETFDVPGCADGMVTITAHGAEGQSVETGGVAGLGGQATGELAVTVGDILEIWVGGQDGFNGGGLPGSGEPVASGGGGGASDVRVGGSTFAERVLVAGGGGGGAAPAQGSCVGGSVAGVGGGGGGTEGSNGGEGTGCGQLSVASGGGTQAMGGAGGTSGGNCTEVPEPGGAGLLGMGGTGSAGLQGCGGFTGGGGGGGGGGYYGGGGGAGAPGGGGGSWAGSGGAGGSSYTGGVANGATTPAVQSGDGDVTVSW